MPDQRTRRNANTMARLEEQRLSRQDQRREPVVEAVVSERSSALPFGSFEDVIEHGSPAEVGEAVDNLQLFEQEYAPRLLGCALVRMKAELPHGAWQDWLRTYWHKSVREAGNYMRFAKGDTPALHSQKRNSNRKHRVQIASDLSYTKEDTSETIIIDATPQEHHCEYETRYRAIIAELKEGMSGTRSQLALLACINRALAIK